MMWVLPEKKLCFLANPKTASIATFQTLQTLGFEHYGDQHAVPASSGWKHWRDINDSWMIFSTVRNHYDVMVSWYFYTSKTPRDTKYFGWTFEKFLYNFSSEPKWFQDGKIYWERTPLCNRILRYETLQRDFDNLLVDHDLPSTQLETHNVSKTRKGRDYHGFYSEKSIQFMEDKFGEEMKLYGYKCF